jgi:hypothetical protein
MSVNQAVLAILLAALPSPPARCQNEQSWARVHGFSGEWRIADVMDRDTSLLAYIRDTKGTPIYKLECHSGNYDDQTEMNFSGDFQCALFAVKNGVLASGNLLAADTKNGRSSDWWNRGRMRSEQLRGECLRFPEYSSARHFRLRGILLTLRFTEVRWSSAKDNLGNPLIVGFTIMADVVPDAGAHSARAERAPGPAPPAACYP